MKLYIGNLSKQSIVMYTSMNVEHGYKTVTVHSMGVIELDGDLSQEEIDRLVHQQDIYGFTDVTKRDEERVEVNTSMIYSVDKPLYAVELPKLGALS